MKRNDGQPVTLARGNADITHGLKGLLQRLEPGARISIMARSAKRLHSTGRRYVRSLDPLPSLVSALDGRYLSMKKNQETVD